MTYQRSPGYSCMIQELIPRNPPPCFFPSSYDIRDVDVPSQRERNMSRSTNAIVAARLLLISFPLAIAYPQLIPPFELNTTSAAGPQDSILPDEVPHFSDHNPLLTYSSVISATPTPVSSGTGSPTSVLVPVFTATPISDPDTSSPLDPIVSPPEHHFPTTAAPSVSVRVFLGVLRPLIEIIQTLLPSENSGPSSAGPMEKRSTAAADIGPIPDLRNYLDLKGLFVTVLQEIPGLGSVVGTTKPIQPVVQPVTGAAGSVPGVGNLPVNPGSVINTTTGAAGAIPAVPAVPGVGSLPAVPAVPGVGAIPAVPGVGSLPAVPVLDLYLLYLVSDLYLLYLALDLYQLYLALDLYQLYLALDLYQLYLALDLYQLYLASDLYLVSDLYLLYLALDLYLLYQVLDLYLLYQVSAVGGGISGGASVVGNVPVDPSSAVNTATNAAQPVTGLAPAPVAGLVISTSRLNLVNSLIETLLRLLLGGFSGLTKRSTDMDLSSMAHSELHKRDAHYHVPARKMRRGERKLQSGLGVFGLDNAAHLSDGELFALLGLDGSLDPMALMALQDGSEDAYFTAEQM
ncbi:hypothetical protein GMOD_00002265 [Pyrenophora seminiperda CCB06]|uniref:Uncharacterized protein n=1 Tax=Pyrenophora seminiperda CCB06 TaxID=1302712 RepID=A0A3M7LX91_9PLEO|nr:hypothetical protein GMOD_00002265 [Pyrenophora seminiperda CCB06]